MKKEQKNIFMGEWTPSEWSNFEENYLTDLKSSLGNGLDVAVKFSRKVLKTHSKYQKRKVKKNWTMHFPIACWGPRRPPGPPVPRAIEKMHRPILFTFLFWYLVCVFTTLNTFIYF